MHPVTHRFQQFDFYDPLVGGMWAALIMTHMLLALFLSDKQRNVSDKLMRATLWVLIALTLYYFYWKFYLCWKGIYYP